jgi:hypothetical protein
MVEDDLFPTPNGSKEPRLRLISYFIFHSGILSTSLYGFDVYDIAWKDMIGIYKRRSGALYFGSLPVEGKRFSNSFLFLAVSIFHSYFIPTAVQHLYSIRFIDIIVLPLFSLAGIASSLAAFTQNDQEEPDNAEVQARTVFS